MTSPLDCPGLDRLKAMLFGTLNQGEHNRLILHLDHCERCQQAVEEAAGFGSPWPRLSPTAEEGQAIETEFRRAMYRLKEGLNDHDGRDERAPAEEPALEFLGPPNNPGQLGTLGPYAVIGVIGRGGMGMVLKAFDPSLHRLVAIKILAPQLATSAAARKRFAREARAAAAVSHEHVVAIHAVDEVDGSPYLVMEYIAGRSLQERLDQSGPLELKEILRIGIQVASGLAAAHAQGLIHRDIKPSNILLENHVERVKITDFGLARTADDASLTQSGVLAGTPQYMAPEQAHGEVLDQRTDLFSLGSVLYAMGTGRPPFRASTAMAVLRRVCDESPRPVREVNPDLPAELAEVIAKLLSKSPDDRFGSAAEVAEQLGRQLAALQQASLPQPQPAPAAPTPAARRFPRKMIAALLLIGGGLGLTESMAFTHVSALVATILRIPVPSGTLMIEVDDPDVQVSVDGDEVIITGAGVHQLRLRPGPHTVKATKGGVPIHDELVTISRGGKRVARVSLEASNRPRDEGKPGTNSTPPFVEQAGTRDEVMVPSPGLLGIPAAPPKPKGADQQPAPKAIVMAIGQEREDIPSWMVSPRKVHPIAILDGKTGLKAAGVAYTRDGKLLAMSSFEMIKLWDVANRKEVATLRNDEPSGDFGDWMQVVWSLAFSPDGKTLAASCFDGTVSLWDVEGRKKRATLTGHVGPDPAWPDHQVWKVAFSPDGSLLASASWDGTARLWDTGTGQERNVLRHPGKVRTLAFSPDGKTLATGMGCEPDRNVRFWDVSSGREVGAAAGNLGGTLCMAFSDDGKTLATGGQDARVRLWDPITGLELANLPGHSEGVEGIAFSPDGRWLTSISGNYLMPRKSGEIRIREAATARPRLAFDDNDGPLHGLAYAPDGLSFATTGLEGTVELWAPDLEPDGNAARDNTLRPFGAVAPFGGRAVTCLSVSGDGKAVAAGSYQHVSIFEIETRRRLVPGEDGPGEPQHPGWIMSVAFSPDGKELASSGSDSSTARIDPARGRVLARLSLPYTTTYPLAYAPGGQELLVPWRDNFIDSWSLASGKHVSVLDQYRPGTLTFASDGKLLALFAEGDPNGSIRLMDWPLGKEGRRLETGCAAEVTCVAFSPDSKTLATGLAGRYAEKPVGGPHFPPKVDIAPGKHAVQLWNLEPERLRSQLILNSSRINGLAFSPDGHWLADVGGDRRDPKAPGFAQLWGLTQPGEVLDRPSFSLEGHEGNVHAVAFTPDGKTLITGGADATIKLWQVPSKSE